MTPWMKRGRGMVGVGLIWAAGWAIGGLVIGISSVLLPWLPWNAFFDVFDAPLPALAMPGFFGGVLFAGVFSLSARGRPLTSISLPRMTAWGALGGALLSLVPATLVNLGLASLGAGVRGQWEVTVAIAGPLMLFCALSAALSLLLARRAERQSATLPIDDILEGLSRADQPAQELPPTTSPSARNPSETVPTHASRWPHRK